jgi:signal transduction histidine kinase
MLEDPSLQLAYLVGRGSLVDARGRPLILSGEVTPLIRGGHEVAQLSHRRGLLDDPGLAEEVAAAARLALDNERLQAETHAQLTLLQASRTRIIATGDAERRRLERDLHDGAQQRLVGLSLHLAQLRLKPDLDQALAQRIDQAEHELRSTLAELRELAHGIFPTVLADEGLAAAVETLAENTAIPIHITALPDQRFDPVVEAAAYFVVTEALTGGASSHFQVDIRRNNGKLVIELEGDRAPDRLLDIEDRVGALDGIAAVKHDLDGRVRLRAEIPCAL